jgi:uncharacterized protein DUF4230
MKTRRFPLLILLFGLAGVVCLGILALGTLAPLRWAGSFLKNPLALSTRVTPSGPVVLTQVQRLQRLETCRYNEQVIVRGDTKGILPTWLAGDRILFVGRGEVVAGIDLSRLRAEDVHVQDRTVALRLPPAEILHSRLDNRQSEVFERQSGLFTGPNRDLESQVRAEAEDRIQQAALDGGVLKAAETNARDLLRGHLQLLGFQEVRFL